MAERGPGRGVLDPRNLRRGVLIVVAIGLSAGVIVALLSDGPAVIAGIGKLPFTWLLAALALSVASWFGQGIGFAALIEGSVWRNLARMTRAFLGGDFPALVTPFGSGGIPGGVFCLTREGLTAGEASAVIAMHSLLTGAFFVIMGVGAALMLPLKNTGSEVAVWGALALVVVAVGLIVWIALRPQRATAWLHHALEGRLAVRLLGAERAEAVSTAADREARQFAASARLLLAERPARLVLSFIGLFASRVFLVVCLPVVMYGLGWRGALGPMIATGIGAMALAVLSPTPGGSGAVEAALTALLVTQTSAPTAAAATLLWRSITYYAEVLAGWAAFSWYLGRRSKRTPGAGTAEHGAPAIEPDPGDGVSGLSTGL